jgi:hypothetical protein
MTDQVTSVEQSKRLIELGVPAEKASMLWEMDEDCARLKIWNTDKETRRVLHNKYPNYYVAAFTVADLLEVLPKAIWDDVKGWSLLVIRFRSKGFPRVGYEAEHGIIWSCGEVSLLGNIIETIDWVITNGYGLDT